MLSCDRREENGFFIYKNKIAKAAGGHPGTSEEGGEVCVRVRVFTEGVVQVLLSHQLQVLLHGLGGQRVLPEDQHVVLAAAVHLRHHQVGQEVLKGQQRVGG